MAGNVILPGSTTPLATQTANPAQTQVADTLPAILSTGRHGQVHTADVHGQFYAGSSRGNVFSANANDGTGRTILAGGGTTSGFMFYNPTGSGVNMEIIEILVLPLTATDVVGVLGLEYGAPPTTVTNAATVRSDLIGGTSQTALCKASYGSTIVAMTFLKWLPMFVQTTAGVLQGSQGLYTPNGGLIIAPGGAVNIISSTTQSTNLWAQSVTWAEWLV
jgi:hypothetical protein